MSDSLKQIQRHVWKRLGVRKFLVGRSRVDQLVEAAVSNWDQEAIKNCKNQEQLDIVAEGMAIGIKRTDQMLGSHNTEEYGFVWAILLQALVAAIVQIMLKWWLESAQSRLIIWAARRELIG
jgi:hypothetical protein